MPVTTLTYNTVPEGTTWEGAAPTIVTNPDPWTGTTNALSLGSLGLSTSVAANLPPITLTNAGRIFVRYNVESEANFDFGKYFIDGVEKLSASGETNWRTGDLGTVSAGTHTLRLTYSEDYAATRGFDNLHTSAVYIVDGDISNLTVNNLLAVDNNVDAFVHWNSFTEGLSGYSFDWSIDGGTTVNNTAQAYATVTGLAGSTNYTFQVRPVSTTYGVGTWSTVVIRLGTNPKTLGPITSNFWSKNSVQHAVSLTQPEIILHEGSQEAGGIAGRLPISLQASTLSAEISMSGGDRVEIGVVATSVNESTPGTGAWGGGMPTQNLATQLFTGFSIDIWTGNIHPYINGVVGTSLANSTMSTGVYATFAVKYSTVSGNLTIQLYKNNVLIHTSTGVAPYSLGRPVIVGGSGSSSATYKIRNTATWEVADLTSKSVTGLFGYPVNGKVTYVWDKLTDATSYEYSLNNGATFTSTGLNNFVEFTGLTNGVAQSFTVRALSSLTGTQTAWTDPVSATPTATPTYSSLVMDKDPSLYLPLNEASGNYKDYSVNRQTYTPIAEARGQTPITSDSTQSVSTTGVGGLGIARGPVIPAVVTATYTVEMWLRIPGSATTVQGTFLKIGDNNGFGVGVGASSTHANLGRNLIGITEGNNWMPTTYNFSSLTTRTHHLVVTRSGTTFTYFIDGTQVGTTTGTQIDPTGQVHIGTSVGTPGRVTSSGINFDAVAIYPTILTGTQINENYNAGVRIYAPEGLESVPLNGGVAVRWPAVSGSVSYDVSTDNGATWVNQAAAPSSTGTVESNSVKITGKTNGTPVTTIVRAKSSNTTSAWSLGSTATPSSTRYVVHWDNYDRAPSTTSVGAPQVGGPYTAHTSVQGISAEGRLYQPNSADTKVIFPGSFNFDYQFQMSVPPNNNAGIIFRWTDVNNHMMFYRSGSSDTTSTYRLWRVVNGSSADLYVGPPGEAKAMDMIRIIGQDKFIHVYVNGIRLVTREDQRAAVTPQPTTMGYYLWISPNVQFDNTVVWNTPDISTFYPPLGTTSHVYKGRDNYNDDLWEHTIMAVYYAEFDTTVQNLIKDIKTKVLLNPDWSWQGLDTQIAVTNAAAAVSAQSVTVASGTLPASLAVGHVIRIGAYAGNHEYRIITAVTATTISFTSGQLAYAYASGTPIFWGSEVIRTTTVRGAPMILDLAGSVINAEMGRKLAVAAYGGFTPPTTTVAPAITGGSSSRSVWLRRNTSALTNVCHVVISTSKDHIFINVEGPRTHEPNPGSTTYGSIRGYVFMSDLVPYSPSDTTPVVVFGGGAPSDPDATILNKSHIVSVSKSFDGTQSWVESVPLALQFPTTMISYTASAQRMTSIDGTDKYYMSPYVIASSDVGLRGRLSHFFFAGSNGTSGGEVYNPTVGSEVVYNGITYKLSAVSKGEGAGGNQFAWGPFGAVDNVTSDYWRSPVVAIPMA